MTTGGGRKGITTGWGGGGGGGDTARVGISGGGEPLVSLSETALL